MLLPVAWTGDLGKATATAGTAIKALVPPRRSAKTRVASLRYTAGTTAHTLTALRPLAKTTVLAAAAAGQAVVVLKIDPGTLLSPARPLAVNDWVVLEGVSNNGYYVFILGQVSAVAAGTASGSLNVTLTANLPTGGVLANATCWMLGTLTDGHPQFGLPASATTTLADTAVGLVGARNHYEPLLLYVDNITAAGTLENATVAYTQEGSSGTRQVAGQAGARQERHVGPQGVFGDMADHPDPVLAVVMALPADEVKATLQAMRRPAAAFPQGGEGVLEGSAGDPLAERCHDEQTGLSFDPVFADPEDADAWAKQVYGEGWGDGGQAAPAPAEASPARAAREELFPAPAVADSGRLRQGK